MSKAASRTDATEVTVTVGPGWVPPGVDTSKANIARVYDWWLGGNHNFRADQDAARAIIAVEPSTRSVMRANRAFLGRAVRFLTEEAGLRQFLDIGSGIPTQQNVHQVAQATAPGTRVVYVDNDEIAVAHSQLMLEDNADAATIRADLREPDKILAAPETQLLIDFSKPVGLLLAAVLHFIPDTGDLTQILGTLRGVLAPGSYLLISHGCADARPDIAAVAQTAYNTRVDADARLRTREQIMRFFDGFTLVEPGLVWTPQWRPDSPADVPGNPARAWCLAGVGRYGDPAWSPDMGR